MRDTQAPTVVILPGARPLAGARLSGFAGADWLLSIWRNRDLLTALVRRDVGERYRGSVLGLAWLVGIPLVMMATYTFLFVGVLKVRFGEGQGPWAGALSIWCGMLFWQALSETLGRAVSVLHDNTPFVKRIPFPLAILPVMPALSACLGVAASTLLFSATYLAAIGVPPATWLLVPFVVAPLFLFALGSSWILASLGAHLRDLKHVVPLGMTVAMFLTPIVFPASAVPAGYRWAIQLNPLASVFEHLRGAVVEGQAPSVAWMAAAAAAGCLYAASGYALFVSRESEYADVV